MQGIRGGCFYLRMGSGRAHRRAGKQGWLLRLSRRYPGRRGPIMTFDEILAQTLDLLQRQGRVSYRALKRQFGLDDDYLEDLKAGREVEIEQLQRALERAGGGHGQIV